MSPWPFLSPSPRFIFLLVTLTTSSVSVVSLCPLESGPCVGRLCWFYPLRSLERAGDLAAEAEVLNLYLLLTGVTGVRPQALSQHL